MHAPYRSSQLGPPFSVSSLRPVFPLGETDAHTKKVEAELEAERLWWSEASERQVKELEEQFGEDFQKISQELRTDMKAVQDRLEVLVETEKSQRTAGLAELRRELENQQVLFSDFTEQQDVLKRLLVEMKKSSHASPR